MYQLREITDLEYIKVLEGRIKEIQPILDSYQAMSYHCKSDEDEALKLKVKIIRYGSEIKRIINKRKVGVLERIHPGRQTDNTLRGEIQH